MTTYAQGLTWGEGPRWHDGALWASDPQRGGIWTDAGDGWAFTPLDSPTNGLWFLPDGRLAGAVMRENRVGVWDGSAFAPHADLSGVAVGPLGDMVGDPDGGLYVDDVGFAAHAGESPRPGRIVYVSPLGDVRVAAEGVEFPNGLAFVDGHASLVVAETSRRCLTAYTRQPDGTLTDRRLYADLTELVGPEAMPDGLCAGVGGVWVCTLTAHCVVLVSEHGVRDRIDLGDRFPVACAIDHAGSRLFVTVADGGGLPVMQAVAEKKVTTTVEVFELGPGAPQHQS